MSKVFPDNSIKFANWLTAIVLVGVPFHAFLTVWASTWLGHYTLLRLWEEGLLVILCIVLATWLVWDKTLRTQFFSSVLVRLIGAYIALTVALGLVALSKHEVTLTALGYGWVVDLRLVVWLLAAWLVASRSNWLQQHWRRLVFWPLAIVAVFALVQFVLLPNNFLTHFGYDKYATVAPYTTINQNTQTIRAQSFLRGPNPLGAYLVLGLGLLAAVISLTKKSWRVGVLALLAGLALFLSFSRSAWIGALVTVALVGWWRLHSRRARGILLTALIAICLVIGGSFVLFRHSRGVQDALLHVHAGSTAEQTSNEGHLAAVRSGLTDMVHEPFGRGPGTAGPASWYNTDHGVRNSESYFLQIGQELGWAGLLLFIAINVMLAVELWRRRSSPLALGLLAALIGLTIVNQFAYAWSDETLAYLWWGLAGIALALPARAKKEAGADA
jgi:hypothetical protein